MSAPIGALVPSSQLVDVLPVVKGRAIFGLHEPARRRDAEDVQVVLDAAADEPAVAVEAVGVGASRGAVDGAHKVCPTNCDPE